MKEKEIEKLLKLLKEEKCYVRTYTYSPTYNEVNRNNRIIWRWMG